MRTFCAEFLNTVHGAPHSQNEFHAEIFFFLLNKFRAGKADNENTLACMTSELMSLADIFYQAEYGGKEK